ncbi:hypothetical protein C0J52_12608 [Blattella germanica]|nr:hypothetical protein C0J52_12608 [Blattella germanica]
MPVFTFEFEVYDCFAVNRRLMVDKKEKSKPSNYCSSNRSAGSQHQRHVVSVTASSANAPATAEMVHTTTATRLVRSPFSTTSLAQGGTSFMVGQASSATIIPSTSVGRRNVTPSIGTIIPLQTQNATSDESMSLIVQLGTTVVATSKAQVLADNSTAGVAKLSSTGRSVSLNYRDFQGGNQIAGTAQVQHQTQRNPVIQSPNINSVVNSNVKTNINCNMQQIHVQHQVVQRQPVTIKQFHTPIKSVASIQPSPNERRLEYIADLKKEDKFEEKGHMYSSDATVAHQLQTEERRMEIVKFVLQDHNYGAPPPASPPISPSLHGKSASATSSGGNVLASSSFTANNNVYQYGSGLLALREAAANDDDANSVISSNPGREVEPEGEETETAPEGEGDDEDSVTRCICDFEHDDGYMICCDKCFVWQHVDCMGIDRSNIPDEYMCERCQPRRIDRQRARTLQLRKREELLNTDSSSDTSSSSTDTDSGEQSCIINTAPVLPSKKRVAAATVNRRKSEPANSGNKRNSSNNSGNNPNANNNSLAPLKQQRQRRESTKDPPQTSPVSVTTNQRRASTGQNRRKESARIAAETKRTPARRKSKNRVSEDESQDSWDRSTTGSGAMVQLRQWIDNYEEAVTNHYSPELRARISSIKVNGIHSDLKAGNLHSILVSTALLAANQPVIELRGKYMLSTQHRPPTLTVLNNKRARPSPGPFIFFYRLPKDGTEVCVDTRTYGNDARFIRRSCKPNAEVRHCIEKGILHLYIVTTSIVEKHAEITINHDGTQDASALVNSGGNVQQFVCACGNPKECMAFGRRNGVHEPTERERRRRGRRTTSSDDGDSAAHPSHHTSVNHNSQTLTNNNNNNNNNSEGPTRRSSTSAKSPVKVLQQPEQESHQQQHQHLQQQQQHQAPSQITEYAEKDHITSEPVSEQQGKKRKLTREERKMEAIMKAFERLEKAEQRRQENQAKQANRKDHHDIPSNSATPKKDPIPDTKRNSVDDKEEVRGRQHISKATVPDRPRRKRRKGRGRGNSTSQNQPPQQRRRTRLNSGDSDATSADESLASASNTGMLHSPVRSGASPQNASNQSSPVSAAAGLLLALANGNTTEGSLPSYHTPPHTTERIPRSTTPQAQGGVNPTLFCDSANSSASSTGSTPPTPLSSACLLVAAAVGPLAPGFKFPKTKKVLMNEWLNKSPEIPSTPATVPPPLSSPILPRPSDLPLNPSDLILNPQVADSYGFAPHHSPSKSLATLAQAANRVALGSSTSPTPHFCRNSVNARGPTSAPGGGVGSAKKRWLRQAISEECDSPTTNSCASPNSRAGSPPCPDYVTPLKKRRLARESMSSEQSFTPPTTPTMLADQHLSNSSPTSQKCPQYEVSGLVSGGCEEDDTIDEEAPLLNDDDYEDREEKCEGDFDGNSSPVNADDCYGRQRLVRSRSARIEKYSTDNMSVQADDRGTLGDTAVSVRRKDSQPEIEDTDVDEKEKELEDHAQTKESSLDDDYDDDDPPSSPVPDAESEPTLRKKVLEQKIELGVNSSEETEEEGCRGFEDMEVKAPQGCEDNGVGGSDSDILNSEREMVESGRSVVDSNTKGTDYVDGTSDEMDMPDSFPHLSVKSLAKPHADISKVTVTDAETPSSPCKDEISEEMKVTETSKEDAASSSSSSIPAVNCAPIQPAKRKLSISEYRQRKQRNTSTELKSQDAESDGGTGSTSAYPGGRDRTNSTSSSSSLSSDDETPSTSLTSKNILLDSSPALSTLPLFLHTENGEEKKGVGEETYMRWNSAPTLVERQRENLTERLRREFGLFLSDDEEQERARKQGLVQDVKDGKKKVPPPPPPPPLPPPDSATSSSPSLLPPSTQHMISMYSPAPNLGPANSALTPVYPSVLVPNSSVSVAPSVNYMPPGTNAGYTSSGSNRQPLSGQTYNPYSINPPLKNQSYGSFPAGLGAKGMSNSAVPPVKGATVPPVSVPTIYQTPTVNTGSGKAPQKYLLANPPPPPPPPPQNAANTQFVLSGPYGAATSNVSSPPTLMVAPSRIVTNSGVTQGTKHFVSPPLATGNSNQPQQNASGNTSTFYTAAAAKAYYPPPPPLPPPPPPPPPPRT